jgi:MFS family permease
LLVVHAAQQLHISADDSRIGLLYTAAAFGAMLAALLLPAMTHSLGAGPLSITAYLLLTAAVCALAMAEAFPVALALWALWNFASTAAITNSITLRQQLTPDDLQGRVNTTGRMIAWGGTPFGALLGGILADTAGARTAYLTLAMPSALAALILVLSPIRGLHPGRDIAPRNERTHY